MGTFLRWRGATLLFSLALWGWCAADLAAADKGGGSKGGGGGGTKPEVVTGYVSDVRETGTNEALFWNVKKGENAVTLTAGKTDDRLSAVCVWDGAPPGRFVKPGAKITVVGVYYGTTTGGAKVYTGCKLKE